jgi:hypothetical protein
MRISMVAALWLLTAAPPPPGSLRVKASPVASPCVAAAAALFTSSTGRPVAVETGNVELPTSATGFDVVVGADEELTRVIEGGASHPDLDVDVARIPWVLLTPASSPAADLAALGRTDTQVKMLGGTVGRRARGDLGPLPNTEKVQASAGTLRVQPGEAAIVPLSLAGPGHVSTVPLTPVLVRAVGVRRSPHLDAARAFLDFLVSESGNAAFRRCGREEQR